MGWSPPDHATIPKICVGLQPACWVADGALGIWSAVNEHCPDSAQQRCTNHKMMNVVDKLPLDEGPEYTMRLRGLWLADRRDAAQKLADAVATDLRVAQYDRAAECLAADLGRCLTFFAFPKAHWSHLRTSKMTESPFASVGLRTNAAKRFKKTKSGVYLVHQAMQRLQHRWRRLNSAHLCTTVPLPKSDPAKAA